MARDEIVELSDRRVRIGLDVGGTKTDAVAVAKDGTILARVRRATGWGEDAVIESIIACADELRAELGVEASAISSVGVGIPGLIDQATGRVVHAVNLGVESLDIAGRVGATLRAPIAVENDVKAAALGAAALRGDAALAYLNLGTGVAAGVVTDGRIWRGARGTAGEVGHISVDPNGRACGCGQRGCIETLCGGGALAKAWGRPGSLPIRDIFDAADEGDAQAVALRADLARGAAAAVRVLVLSVDADTVVIGGGITALGDRLHAQVVTALRRDAEGSPFLRSLQLHDRIELLPPGSPAAALGAALVGAAASSHRKEPAGHG
ncbi:ROK family protein [Microbacterium sp. NPDC055903]